MTFTQLRTFALVAELGSLRAAADALGVSEPAVSAAVAALRTDLGDPLFRRTGVGITLTPGGRALAGRASRSFIIGSRLCPPAITRASGPWRSSSSSAFSTLVARTYSNGAGTCTGTPPVQGPDSGPRWRRACP